MSIVGACVACACNGISSGSSIKIVFSPNSRFCWRHTSTYTNTSTHIAMKIRIILVHCTTAATTVAAAVATVTTTIAAGWECVSVSFCVCVYPKVRVQFVQQV
jgi:hypothetical protein